MSEPGKHIFSKVTGTLMVPVFCFLWSVQPALLHAQEQHAVQAGKAYDILARRGELYFSFRLVPAARSGEVCNTVSVDRVIEGRIFAYANRRQFEKFLTLNIPFEVLTPPSERAFLNERSRVFGPGAWNEYPAFGEYVDMMHGFASDHPGICRLDTIGFSVLGRAILAVRISGNPQGDQFRPVFFYTSTMHGDEVVGKAAGTRLHLLAGA